MDLGEFVRTRGDVLDAVIARHAHRLGLTPADAADAVQEALARAQMLGVRFVAEGEAFAWLRTTAGNILRDHRRSALHQRTVLCAEVAAIVGDPEPDPAVLADEWEEHRAVGRAFGRLPLRLRVVLHAGVIEGDTSAEIAARTGVTARAVRKTLGQAKRELRRLYEQIRPAVVLPLVPLRKTRDDLSRQPWWAVPTTQSFVAGLAALSATAFVGVVPIQPPAPTDPDARPRPILIDSQTTRTTATVQPILLDGAPSAGEPATTAGRANRTADLAVATPAIPEEEAEAAGVCAGTGKPCPKGHTVYLKRFGPEGPHITEPFAEICYLVPDNPEVGCQEGAEPDDGYLVTEPPPAHAQEGT